MSSKLQEMNEINVEYTLTQAVADVEFGNTFSEEIVQAGSLEEICEAYAQVDRLIKDRTAQRQEKTRALKKEVESIEKPYRPVLKSLEQVKGMLHGEISKRVINDLDGEKFQHATVSVYETTPKRTYEAIDMKKIPLEFLQINQEAIDAYVTLFGDAPDGVLMCETRQCRIVNGK